MNRSAVARRLVAVIAVFNVLVGSIYFIIACAALHYAAQEALPSFGLRSFFLLLYGIFLFACGVGLWRESPWGWYSGMAAGGFALLWAVVDLLRGAWGVAAFDAVYGGLLLGCLLHLRRSET